jgi:hypothetical protein
VAKGEDILKREGVVFKYVPLSYYPSSLQKVMEQYPQLLRLKKGNSFTDLYYSLRRVIKGNY